MSIKQLIEEAKQQGVQLFVEQGRLGFKVLKGGEFSDQLKAQVSAHKAAIIGFFEQYQSAPEQAVPPLCQREDNSDVLALSYAQQRLWFVDQLQGGSPEYNMPSALKVEGDLDLAAVTEAMAAVICRHEVLRTVYFDGDNGGLQCIRHDVDFKLTRLDLTTLFADEQAAELQRLIDLDSQRPFDLRHDLMVRVSYIALGERQGVLLFNMHHIASDGWSKEILIGEFIALYQASQTGQADPLAPLAFQYADYAQWQRQWLQGEVLETQLSYWQEQLDQIPLAHSLVLDYPRPKIKQSQGGQVCGQISAEVAANLLGLSKRMQLTPFMLLHSVLALMLARHSNSDDIVIGAPVANRTVVELESLIGFFVNTLVLRVDTSLETLAAYFDHVREVHLAAQSHQDVPFEQLVERLNLPRSSAYSPLFQIMLTTKSTYTVNDGTGNDSGSRLDIPGVHLSSLQAQTQSAKFDLEVNINLNPNGAIVHWTYDTALFSQAHIQQFSDHLCRLLNKVAKLSSLSDSKLAQTPIKTLTLLSDQEQVQQLQTLNDTRRVYDQTVCIHQLFEARVLTNPDQVALIVEETVTGGAGEQLTYGQLNQRANQLATYLIEHHQVKPDTLVGLCALRSVEMVVAIMAILKAGGAYVPLDPDYPQARLDYLLSDANLKVILTQQQLLETVQLFGDNGDRAVLVLDDAAFVEACFDRFNTDNIAAEQICLNAEHLAYVIYTSGSTGQPKGVLVSHQALHNRIDWMQRQYGGSGEDKILQKTPYSFDVSVWEFIWPLSVGAQLVMAKPGGHKDPQYLSELIQRQQISKLHFVPSMLSVMLQQGDLGQCHSIKQVFCSGEALSWEQINSFTKTLPTAQLHNLYGPTEAAIDVSFSDCTNLEAQEGQAVPIGVPIQNIQLLILDPQLNLVPFGALGELHISGDGLARGYLNKPQMNAERFIDNPFYQPDMAKGYQRLYKTGDLVAYRKDGQLAYMGRIDDQVKIRGLRIELGEINYQISSHTAIDSSLVMAKPLVKDDPASLQLLAYIQPLEPIDDIEQQNQLIDSLKQLLAQSLPDYMVPNLFVVINQWPLTSNGKVDRKALPEPDAISYQGQYVAPQSATEHKLVQIWASLLGLSAEQISTNANFFELGGHSLLVMRMIAQARKDDLTIHAQQVFSATNLAQLAADIIIDTVDVTVFVPPLPGIAADCQQITPEMLPMLNFSMQDIDKVVETVAAGAANIKDIYPLAPLQEGILFHHMMSEGSDPYVMPTLMRIDNQGLLNQFLAALQGVIDRHDALRTAILWQDLPEPVQVVYREAALPVSWLILDPAVDALSQMEALCAVDKQWIDLNRAPLLRVQIAQVAEQNVFYILLQMHHMVDDVTSLILLQNEVLAFMLGRQDELDSPSQYRDFVAFCAHQARERDAAAFFTEMLQDIDEPTLPYNLADVTGDGTNMNQVSQTLSRPLSERLRSTSKALKVSPAAFFHGAWALVVGACSGRDDVVFGTVLSGRLQGGKGVESTVGMFINSLPLRVKLANCEAGELLQQVQRNLHALIDFEQTPLPLAQSCSGVENGTALFSSILNYRHSGKQAGADAEQQARDQESEQQKALNASIGDNLAILQTREHTNYPFAASVSDLADDFIVKLEIVAQVDARRVLDYVIGALTGLLEGLDKAQPVTEICILPEIELQQQLYGYNDTLVDFDGKDACIQQLFEAQARANPDNVALIFDDAQGNVQQLTYAQVNHKANQVAHYLRQQHQLTPDTLVGLCIRRSFAMVIGMLGIQKAGGAYVPLDPDYPKSRLEYMLVNAQLKVVLSETALLGLVDNSASQWVCLDNSLFDDYPSDNLEPQQLGLTPSNLAYVIYTSGSTGQPKGVMVEHRSLVNLAQEQAKALQLKPGKRMLQFASISFDVAVWEWAPTLTSGAAMVLAHGITDMDVLTEVVINNNVTHGAFYPTFLAEFDDALLRRFDYIITGAGVPSKQLVDNVSSQTKLNLAYGPTESTVTVTATDYDADIGVNMGVAIANISLYVLDKHLQIVPDGVVGELYIGGIGLARGYVNNPTLTAERFIDNPFYQASADGFFTANQSSRLYRTGDLVRYLKGGYLAFEGRIDEQVKIRGYRIELGEIESQISLCDGVDSVIVLAQAIGGEGSKHQQLVAFVKSNVAANIVSVDDIKQKLSEVLPEYMVPRIFVLVDEWPLTSNRKVDKNALQNMVQESQALQNHYVAPVTEVQQYLCAVWAEVLKLERVGIEDNYFAIGGDSIISIQIASRARQYNCHFSVRQLFEHQTIKQLSTVVTRDSGIVAEQGKVSGAMPLLPIQSGFFALDMPEPHHFNQSVLLQIPAGFDGAEALVGALYQRHDALRLRFKPLDVHSDADHRAGPLFCAVHDCISAAATLIAQSTLCIDLSELAEAQQKEAIERICAEQQRSLSYTDGPIFKVCHFDLGDQQNGRLLLISHHLVVDGVSWRVLMKDLELAYQQWSQGKPIVLGDKTSAYKAWGEALHDYASSNVLQVERAYWLEQLSQPVGQLPIDTALADTTPQAPQQMRVCHMALNESDTQALLSQCSQMYRTQVNELLLAALLRAYQLWTDKGSLRINMEGHGREALFDEIDTNETVGWFTSLYPLILSGDVNDGIGELIKAVKEQYRAIPHHGIGFGVLKTLNNDEQLQQLDAQSVDHGLLFNYLGQFDNTFDQHSGFTGAAEHKGPSSSALQPLRDILAINGQTSNKVIGFSFAYHPGFLSESSVQTFTGHFEQTLQAIVRHCMADKTTVVAPLTPSDFPQARISIAELDSLQQQQVDIERLYITTPMQRGMLYHGMLDGTGALYTTVSYFDLLGQLNLDAFEQAWRNILVRHDILRTSFVDLTAGVAHQLVHKQVDLPFTVLDWRQQAQNLSSTALEAELSALRSQEKDSGFDFRKPPLMRITLVCLPEGRYHFVWAHHHILLDGWCLPVLFDEVLQFYLAGLRGTPLVLPAPALYENYIGWLNQANEQAAMAFWRDQLADFTTPTRLGLKAPHNVSNENQADFAEVKFVASAQLSDGLSELAKTNQCTLNVLLQLAWYCVQSCYCGESDVMFGAVVSGRPPAVAGIEQMVGLFINTVPVRIILDSEQTLQAAMKQVHKANLDREQYGYLGLSQVLSSSELPVGELFESLFVFENYPTEVGGQASKPDDNPVSNAQTAVVEVKKGGFLESNNYPLAVMAAYQHTLSIRFGYQPQRFSRAAMQQLMSHLQTVLHSMVAQGGQAQLKTIEMIAQPERDRLLSGSLANAAADYPRGLAIHQLFEQQAQLHPDNIALAFEHRQDGVQQMSYRQLNAKANQLAAYLRTQHGVKRDMLVGVCVERGFDLPISILAILKAGGAYVPLDPDYPKVRLDFMLKDADLKVVLIQQKMRGAFAGFALQGLAQTTDGSGISEVIVDSDIGAEFSTANRLDIPENQSDNPDDSLAYVIYTSGSSGQPKGVLTPHKAVNRLVCSANFMDLNEQTVFLQSANVAFDAATLEIWGPLLNGGCCVLFDGNSVDLASVNRAIALHQVNSMWLTAGVFTHWSQQLAQNCQQNSAYGEMLKSLQWLLCGGDVVNPQAVRTVQQYLPEVTLVNGYGPTENTTFSCCYAIPRLTEAVKSVPIGYPVQGDQVLVLSPDNQLVAHQLVGELCVGGDGLARGYLNQPALTEVSFITNPYYDDKLPGSSKRLYKTGDLVRYLADGSLEFVGRRDFQLKIRGFRIELGEIEHQINKVESVAAAVVLANENELGDKYLVAYVQRVGSETADDEQLISLIKQRIRQHLPGYMLPARYAVVTQWPLSSNGKVDTKALPLIDDPLLHSEYVAPQTDTEKTLATLWSTLLAIDVDKISATANFFDLGGHSLLTVRLIALVKQQFNVDMSLQNVFEQVSLKTMADTIVNAHWLHQQAETALDSDELEVFEL